MSTTSEAIDYSDEEYSSDYSGSDLDDSVDDPHPFGNNTRRTIQNGKPKERIRRTGKVPLNLTRNYGLKSGWGMSQGFRELIQNFADNVRENPDGSPREVEWIHETGPQGNPIHYIAYAKGQVPRLNRQTGLHNLAKSLGYIILRRDKRRVILVNHDTRLSRSIWSMGESSKGSKPHQIGGHGEGMKVGILALLRQGCTVNYYTNKEIWEWCFCDFYDPDDNISNQLTIQLQPCRPRKAIHDTTISDDVREARRSAGKHTTVIVENVRYGLDINFEDYLFLVQPPQDTLLASEYGTILTSTEHREKMFVKGIFVERRGAGHRPPLSYGVDFSQASLDRDRRSLMTGNQIAETLGNIWDDLISRDHPGALDMYLQLLQVSDANGVLETQYAKETLKPSSVEKLFRRLTESAPEDHFFYNVEDNNVHETIRIIKDCLGKVPQYLPSKLYEILLEYKHVVPAVKARFDLFFNAPQATPNITDPWINHTLHVLKSSILIHPLLEQCTYEFREAPRNVSIDIMPDATKFHYHIHSRWLSFDFVHEERPSCPLAQTLKQNREQGIEAVCDCAVEDIIGLLLDELQGELTVGKRRGLMKFHKDLLNVMPRHVKMDYSKEIELGKIQTQLSWEICTSLRYRTSFQVMVMPGDYGDVNKPEHRFLPPKTPDPTESSKSGPCSSSVIENASVPASQENEAATEQPPSQQQPLESEQDTADDHGIVFQDTATRSCSYLLEGPHPSLEPGSRYVALIRPSSEYGGFYSLPLPFHVPYLTPRNIIAKRVENRIEVSWDSLPVHNAKFRIICESLYDVHHTSELVDGNEYSFDVVDGLPELQIRMRAENGDGISSKFATTNVEAEVVPIPEDPKTPSAISVDDDDDCIVVTPLRRTQPERQASARRTRSSSRPIIISDDEEDVVDSIYDDLAFYEPRPQRELTPSAPVLAPAGIAPDVATRSSVHSFQSTQLESIFLATHLVTPRRSYRVRGRFTEIGISAEDVIIHVHSIQTGESGAVLLVTPYIRAPQWLADQDGEFVCYYRDWRNVGEKQDAVTLCARSVTQVLGECQIRSLLPEEDDSHDAEQSTTFTSNSDIYTAKWALYGGSDYFEFRMMRNRAGHIEIRDGQTLTSLRTPLRVHNYNAGIGGFALGFKEAGFNLAAGVEVDRDAITSFKKNLPNLDRVFPETLREFLDRFENRVENHSLTVPSVVVISPPLDKEVSDDWIQDVVQVAKVVTPLIIVSDFSGLTAEESTPDERLLGDLVKMGYEVRRSSFNLSDFGSAQVREGETVSLLASKVGLPSLVQPKPQKERDITKKLLEVGYSPDYIVAGEHKKQIQLIDKSIPFPIGNAIAHSIKEHLDEVSEGVNYVCEEVLSEERKRNADGEDSRTPKKARRE